MAAAAVDRRRKKREFCKLIFAVAISRHLVSVKVTFYWIEIKLGIQSLRDARKYGTVPVNVCVYRRILLFQN